MVIGTNWLMSQIIVIQKMHPEFKKIVYGSNFVAALAHYLLFTHFAACWEVNKIWWLKSEAGVITFLN